MRDDIPLTREFVVDERFPGQAAWALVKQHSFRRGMPWLGFGIIAFGILFVALKPGEWFGWVIVGLGLLSTVILPAVIFFSVRRVARRQYPDGSRLRTGFGTERFAVDSPSLSATLDYSMYSAVRRRGDFVFLRQASTKAWGLYPGVLFSDEDLARFPQK